MTKKRKILVTHALPYANGSLHIGHLIESIQTDIWVRFQKMMGHETIFICGSDSHGTPIMIQAEKFGITPEKMIADMQIEHQKDFSDFAIEFDNYHTTHSNENHELVETIYERHLKAGNIDKRTIKQLFDPVKNMFLPDRFIKGECPRCSAKDQYGDSCEVCGATYSPIELKNPYSTLSGAQPIEKESEHYFFKLENFEKFLRDWTQGGHLQEQVTNKLNEWFAAGLRDWDISRDAPYFGFLIPGEKDKYFYVWLDAPIGYIASFKNLCTKRKELNFDDYWSKTSQAELYHFIGKDITYFHALFWPALLHGAQFRTPTSIFVHGFLTVDGQKMSKSRGTFIKARTYLNHLNPEYLRYYFAAKLSARAEDIDINFDDFVQRINSDLVGKFINIASRCAGFLTKNFDGKLAKECKDTGLFYSFSQTGDEIAQKWEKLEYNQAVRLIMALADRANQYIDEKKPWALIKDPANAAQVQDICTMGINLFRVLMIYLKPVLPQTAARVEKFLQIAPLAWQDKDNLLLDHHIAEYQPLINRIDPNQIEAMKMDAQQDIKNSQTPATTAATTTTTAAQPTQPETISIDDFVKIDLRIAKILSAEPVEGADKLLRLKVDIGNNEERQIFAGIKSAFQSEDLVGKHIVVVANLAPRKMRFGMSEGMMIVASDGSGDLFLVSPQEGAKPGMKVK